MCNKISSNLNIYVIINLEKRMKVSRIRLYTKTILRHSYNTVIYYNMNKTQIFCILLCLSGVLMINANRICQLDV